MNKVERVKEMSNNICVICLCVSPLYFIIYNGETIRCCLECCNEISEKNIHIQKIENHRRKIYG
jgi:hypothetical protein